jgi:hypothetical protein
MSKTKLKRKYETAIIENGLLLIQVKTPKNVTVTVTRPEIGAFLEPVAERNGVGHDVTTLIKDAILGKVGMKFVQSKTGHKEVSVEITGM